MEDGRKEEMNLVNNVKQKAQNKIEAI